jgi:hypothetical protein
MVALGPTKATFKWWHWLPRWRWRIIGVVEAADEIPARLPQKGVVVVGLVDDPKWLAFDCPCLTGHRIMVNLDVNRLPHWEVFRTSALTVWPSIDCVGPRRRCHYLIAGGRVIWIPDRRR